jgi:hypothetical protein
VLSYCARRSGTTFSWLTIAVRKAFPFIVSSRR